MNALVQVPWQPECWLTPDTLQLLEAASNELGTQLRIDGANGAWRSYDEQKRLYDLYLSGAGNTASNPDTGQRNHMRGGAFDLVRTDAAAQAACRKVGLVRDGYEQWHWNNPRWASMPIIPTNTTTAADAAQPIQEDTVPNFELGTDDHNGIYVLGPQGVSAIPNATVQLPLFQRLVHGERHFTGAEWKAIDETLNRRL